MNPDRPKRPVPTLTDVIDPAEAADALATAADVWEAEVDDACVAELQTELAVQIYHLTDKLLHAAFTELEAALFEQISTRLRKELPDLIDQILREQLAAPDD